MILDNSNANFTRNGASSEEELSSSTKILIYKSESLITSASYSGSAEKITESTSISQDFTKILKNICGFVSLGTTKGYTTETMNTIIYKNAHVYAKSSTLDGINRLGYIYAINDSTIGFSECSKNRGSSYSSLYRVLKKKLIENDFKQNSPYDNFHIDISDAQKFVDIINEVISESVNNKYLLMDEPNVFDTITLGKGDQRKKLYFNRAYWYEKEDKSITSIESPLSVDDIAETINKMIKKIDLIDSMDDIELICSKVKSLLEFAMAKKQMIQIKEEFIK